MRSVKRWALIVVAIATVVDASADYGHWPTVARLVIAAVALAGLAWIISLLVDRLGSHFGPAITGMLQATFGNLPELFVVIFALDKGQLVLAQTAIVGSVLANALLILGLVIVVGARASPDGTMRFSARLPRDTATLLLVTIFIIVLLGLSLASHDPASHHVKAISAVGAVCILGVYLTWVVPYLRSPDSRHLTSPDSRHLTSPDNRHLAPAAPGEGRSDGGRRRRDWTIQRSVVVLVVLLLFTGVISALASDWFVNALTPAISSLHIPAAFAGLVIVALAGNAVEQAVGIVLAAKGQADLAISVVKSSVSQIAAFLFPGLVLISFALRTQLTFALGPVYIGALALMALAVWQVTGDGEAATFEGWALVALYVILATITLFE